MRFDLIGVGEAMVELFADEPLGEAAVLRRRWGGDVLNALVAASRAGGRVSLVTWVGDDPFGPGLRREWEAEGVDVSRAPLVPGENGVYFISLVNGEREFTYRRAGSAASHLAPEHLDAAHLASTRTLLLSGITQALSDSAQAATLEAARIARAAGVTVAFDPNYRASLWAARGGAPAARRAWGELAPLVDVLLPSLPADLPALGLPEHLPADEALARLGECVPLVALKAAERGAYLAARGAVAHVPAQPVAVVDSTGAGDAWNGDFLLSLARGALPHDAAAHAHRASAHVLRHRGAIPPHTRQETT
ncbi:PfkB domain-containing protein [Deinococcus aerius]|uniref:PfkB domain-containing protein n=1 Tax=Deinococcus aerius TaxID=200253 RepID=A0A2I9DYS8_9DEIO|nr:sugar kinase [Deinococcus aerius]GBF06075.1 PfkB domain-containing protein [Deinococcus aerius]